jgi:hypothetical protein
MHGGAWPFLIQAPLVSNYQNELPTTPISVVGDLCFDVCFSQLEPKPPSGGQTKKNELYHVIFLRGAHGNNR